MFLLKVLFILILLMIQTPRVHASSDVAKRILFIHHSTGGNLIREGNLRKEIAKRNPNIELWDHNYNLYPIFTAFLAKFTHLKGLSDGQGTITGQDYSITLSNNSPKEYAEIFSRDPEDPTLREILSYDIIAFKNCYPTTRIISDSQLEEDRKYYSLIRESLKKYPQKKFVLMTPPPARRETTNLENAQRAKLLVAWLNSKDFMQESTNVHIFDFFTLLSDKEGMLKNEYTRLPPWDSHPNKRANIETAEKFAEYLTSL